MIRTKVNGVEFVLPSTWGEIEAGKCVEILELRERKLPVQVFYYQALKLLLGIPTGKKWQLVYFFSKWKPVFSVFRRKNPELWAKMMFLRYGEEEEKMDVMRWLQFLGEKPVFALPCDLHMDLREVEERLHIKVNLLTPDREGRRFCFEQLLDGFIFYQKFCETREESYLNQLIASLYCYVGGKYEGMYVEALGHEVAKLRSGVKTRVLLWYQGWYDNVVKDHPEVFKPGKESENPDPYGLVGFMHRIAGAVKDLEQTKKTPGLEALDNIEIQIFDQQNRKPEIKP